MKRWETMKRLIYNLLTVYSGTSQNTSLNEKIFHSSVQNSVVFTPAFAKDDNNSKATDKSHDISTDISTDTSADTSQDISTGKPTNNSKDNTTDDSMINYETAAKDNLTLKIEDINFILNRNVSLQEAAEVSIILPKTEIKKTYYQNDKITAITEMVLSNLTIIHNPKTGQQIISTTDNEEKTSQEKPKLTIGFNTDEIEKSSP